MPGHFVVCGMGQVGYRVVQLLLRLGESVTVVTVQPRPEWIEAIRAGGATVHLGDARDRDRLLAAGLLEARALLALTSQDLVNIEVALDARQLRADLPVVIRVFDPTLAQQLDAQGLLSSLFIQPWGVQLRHGGHGMVEAPPALQIGCFAFRECYCDLGTSPMMLSSAQLICGD